MRKRAQSCEPSPMRPAWTSSNMQMETFANRIWLDSPVGKRGNVCGQRLEMNSQALELDMGGGGGGGGGSNETCKLANGFE